MRERKRSILQINLTTRQTGHLELRIPAALTASMQFVDALFVLRKCAIAGLTGMFLKMLPAVFCQEYSWHLALSQRSIEGVGHREERGYSVPV